MREATPEIFDADHVALVELVNRVVDKGVVLSGELTISVADVDLLYLGIRLLLCSADRVSPPLVVERGASEEWAEGAQP